MSPSTPSFSAVLAFALGTGLAVLLIVLACLAGWRVVRRESQAARQRAAAEGWQFAGSRRFSG